MAYTHGGRCPNDDNIPHLTGSRCNCSCGQCEIDGVCVCRRCTTRDCGRPHVPFKPLEGNEK